MGSDLKFFMVHDYYLEFIFQYSLHCNLWLEHFEKNTIGYDY